MVAAQHKASHHLEGKFKVVGVIPGIVNVHGVGEVDLRDITLEQAERLHTQGFRYLRKVQPPKKKSTGTKVRDER
ncbi:hypothetical protein [Rufibacter soli]